MNAVLSASRLATGLVAAAALVACGAEAGPPAIELDRSVCARCGMLISEPHFAAGYRAGDATAVFDDIGCLLDAMDEAGLDASAAAGGEAAPRGEQAELWFLDSEQRWMPLAEVLFVRSEALAAPMNGGIQAFTDRAAAEETAARVGGSIIDDLAELRASRREALAHRDSS